MEYNMKTIENLLVDYHDIDHQTARSSERVDDARKKFENLQRMSESQSAILRTAFKFKLDERDDLVMSACSTIAKHSPEAAAELKSQLQNLQQQKSIEAMPDTTVNNLRLMTSEMNDLRAKNRELEKSFESLSLRPPEPDIDLVKRRNEHEEAKIAARENHIAELMALLQEARNALTLRSQVQASIDEEAGKLAAELERTKSDNQNFQAQSASLEVEVASLQKSLTEADERDSNNMSYAEVAERMQETLSKTKEELVRTTEKAESLEKQIITSKEEASQTLTAALADKERALAESKTEFETEREKLTKQLRKLGNKTNFMGKSIGKVLDSARALKTSTKELRDEAHSSATLIPKLTRETSNAIIERINAHEKHKEELERLYRSEHKERRRLFNLVQELRGNIRVICRCRPPSEQELSSNRASVDEDNNVCVEFESDSTVRVTQPANRDRKKAWEFDKCFAFGSKQCEVYDEVAPLVTSVLDGYNVCIFAYGQTGSGKTYTMMGSPDNWGINTRTLQELFKTSEERASEVEDEIKVSILEIYCEQINDLLTKKSDASQRLEVRRGEAGNYVPNLIEKTVRSMDEVLKLLSVATQNRSTASTNMNHHSSRSHLMLNITVRSRNLMSNQLTWGKLHLVDLAGSERVAKSGVTGQALKEAVSINKSLSALGDVIMARSQKNAHVPFRNSTLTHLLQDSLSGDSKTLMFVCISPILFNATETICSLTFAARVNAVELGKANRNSTNPGESKRTGRSPSASARRSSLGGRAKGLSNTNLKSLT